MTFRSALYRGHLTHVRRDRFATRSFRYPVYMASIDPDELPALARGLRLFAHGGRAPFALHDADYDGAERVGLRVAHERRTARRPEALRLVTNLRTFGYVFNPVSFFLGYQAGVLDHATAEINNTYGGRHTYLLDDTCRVAGATPPRFRRAREFYVSPFLHGELSYEFSFDAPLDGDALTIHMDVHDTAGARVFVADLRGERVALTDRSLAAVALRYPLMAVQVIALIHWQALRLHARRVPFLRPGPDHRPHAIPSVPRSSATVRP